VRERVCVCDYVNACVCVYMGVYVRESEKERELKEVFLRATKGSSIPTPFLSAIT